METVEIIDVGRTKRSWEIDVERRDAELAAVRVLQAVQKSGALMSSGIEVEIYDDDTGGEIIVGGFRTVGRWRFREPKEG